MKILIFNWRDIKHPKAGGSEQYFHELAKRWVKKGNTVTWISGGWKNCGKEEIIDGIKVIRIGGEITLYALAPLKYLRLDDQDVIIDVDNGLPFLSPLFSRKKKFLHMHHVHKDVWFKEAQGSSIKNKFIALIAYFIETNLIPLIYRNTKVITISESSAKEIEKEKIGKIKGVINPAITVYRKARIKRTKFPSILFVNRIKKYKGVDTLVKAFLKIADKKEMKNAVLYIAGSGDYSEEIKKLASKRIKILGRITEEEKYKLMEKSWIFINPSFKEGWGIVNVEASYFGMPVVGSNVSGIKDSVINGKTGLLFEYGNSDNLAKKILMLIKNKKLREKLGRNARQFARSFSWEKAAQEYIKIINN